MDSYSTIRNSRIYDVLRFIFIFFGSLATVVFPIAYLSAYLSGKSCRKQAEIMNVNHKFEPLIGCMIQTNSGWIHIQRYRVIE